MENEFYTIVSRDGKSKGKAFESEELQCEIDGCNRTQYIVEWDTQLFVDVV